MIAKALAKLIAHVPSCLNSVFRQEWAELPSGTGLPLRRDLLSCPAVQNKEVPRPCDSLQASSEQAQTHPDLQADISLVSPESSHQ